MKRAVKEIVEREKMIDQINEIERLKRLGIFKIFQSTHMYPYFILEISGHIQSSDESSSSDESDTISSEDESTCDLGMNPGKVMNEREIIYGAVPELEGLWQPQTEDAVAARGNNVKQHCEIMIYFDVNFSAIKPGCRTSVFRKPLTIILNCLKVH